ncbi:EAL domain-containing protein [Oscillatoria sp. CS-180]|uniref:putative bifunctional diguanylate cyclase/phosphodiesterase n=1 Tax=Oscillatoria sp. CS-180 TaxID=3021720 RepID=UPI002330CA9D|nr:EAL domain-containing protein [Oscillatoria sp. CS-180]MDB9524875.1 EAL domain-containing protein [Oscillatoria sp. CS-180]
MARSPADLYRWTKPYISRLSQSLPFSGRSILIATLVAATFVTGIKKLGGLQRFELFIFDSLVRLKADEGTDSRLVIIGITEADIQKYGHPLSDQSVADILAGIQRHNPKVVGLDIYRKTFHPPGRQALEQQLAANNLIVITNVGTDPTIDAVPPPSGIPWERIGFNDLSIDPDGVLRRGLLFVNASDKRYYSFALRATLAYLAGQQANFNYDDEALYISSQVIRRLETRSGGYEKLDSRGFQTLLRFRSRIAPADQISVDDVLKGNFDPAQLNGRIVLIGSVAPSLKDEFYTPYSANRDYRFTMSGVVVHAQIISQLLDIAEGRSAQYHFLPVGGELLWLIAWAVLTSVLTWRIRSPEVLLIASFAFVLSLFVIGWIFLAELVWLPIFEPLLGILVAGALVIAQKSIYRSTYDSLTDLPGREVFLLHIKRALNTQKANPVIVAFLDIDRFQIINKSLGHFAGDRVLIAITKRLRKILSEHAQIARIGGDEFAILFHKSSQQDVKAFLNEMRSVLSSPLMLGRHRFSITASVGLAITKANYGQTPDELLRDAHTAMYRAKALKEAQYQVFSNDMREEAVARLDLESDLIKALEDKEFSLFYQPIIHLETGRVSGFEALIRWKQEKRGLISPSDFIPVVEETGMIIPLGEWILKTACHQIKAWNEQFPDLSLKMSINLSRRQFDQPDLVPQIEAVLSQLGISGRMLQLEITESMIMRDFQAAHDLMLKLKALGIELAIDDFGTGYSSLSYLHRFPTDTLKIDRSFVSSMENSAEDREIVQIIISLGQKLNMHLVAEGISSPEQLALLKEANCHYGQGYYFSKPMPVDQATAYLKNVRAAILND